MDTEEQQAQDSLRKERRLKALNRPQMMLRTVDVERLIEADHPARAIWELVERLDLSRFQAEMESAEGEPGRPAYDPQLLISVWIYTCREAVSSV